MDFINDIKNYIESSSINEDLKVKFIKDIYNIYLNKLNNTALLINKELKCESYKSSEDRINKVKTKVENVNEIDKPIKKEKINIFDGTKCKCRVFNTGLGTQCTRNKKKDGYCNAHYKKYKDIVPEYGYANEDKPICELSGKNKGKKIQWKLEETLKKSDNTIKEPIKNDINGNNEISDNDEIIDEELQTISNIKMNTIELESDNEEIEIDDVVNIQGVEYDQSIYDKEIYLLKDGIQVATWNGLDIYSIKWKLKAFENKHISMKI